MLARQHRAWCRGDFICSSNEVPGLVALHMPTGATGGMCPMEASRVEEADITVQAAMSATI